MKISSFLTFAQGEQFTTKSVDVSSGLYFEETGRMSFYNHEWKIVTNINLTKYRTELNNIQDIVTVITSNCEELKQIEMEKNASVKGNEGCGPVLYRLSILMADIEENDSNWFGKDTRVKRNVIAELVLGDWPEDPVIFSREFSNMVARGIKTRTSPVKETSYISSTLNTAGILYEKNQMAINEYVSGQLSSVQNTLVAARNGSVNVVRLYQLRTTIQDIISYQMLILTTFASKQKQFLSMMPLVGKKNAQIPNILQSDVLMNELNNIRDIVSERGLDFPMKLTTENVQFLIQLASPEISLYNNNQIFVTFQVPLISKLSGNYFTLFKITSALHHLSHNLYSFVDPIHDFIAIDAHKEHYTILTVEDLNGCRQISNVTSIICARNSPVMSTMTASECEISLIQQRPSAAACNDRYIRNNAEIFIKVLKPNTWLVTMPKITKVRYMCEGETTQEFLIQINGLLTIGSNCKFATDNVVITGHNTFPKSTIHEHQRGISSTKLEAQLKISNTILTDDRFTSNDISQVINFGENEKLFQISYSTKRQIDGVSGPDLFQEKVELFFKYWMMALATLLIVISVVFIVHMTVLYILSRRAVARHFKMENLKKLSQLKANLRASKTAVKPSAPLTTELK